MTATVTFGMDGSGTAPRSRAGRTTFELSDPGLNTSPMGMAIVNLGEDPHGPCAITFHLEPNLEFAAHYHDTDQCFVVLEGSIRVGRTWYGPGSVRVQNAGSVYGPVLSGPEGCEAISFYGDRSAIPDQFASERDRKRSEELMAKMGFGMGNDAPLSVNP
jgi:mannose-6-phosphate isomerase-like protein (cupin superfamily)